jgi:uncharacterized membrane protein YwzB
MFTKIFNGVLYAIVAILVGYSVVSFWVHYYGALINGA